MVDTGVFDVWILNLRGNVFSREHSFLDADTSQEFWDFSFEEFGDIDIPTVINFILSNHCKEFEKIQLVGYS